MNMSFLDQISQTHCTSIWGDHGWRDVDPPSWNPCGPSTSVGRGMAGDGRWQRAVARTRASFTLTLLKLDETILKRVEGCGSYNYFIWIFWRRLSLPMNIYIYTYYICMWLISKDFLAEMRSKIHCFCRLFILKHSIAALQGPGRCLSHVWPRSHGLWAMTWVVVTMDARTQR